jgi:spore coat protein U-like protein
MNFKSIAGLGIVIAAIGSFCPGTAQAGGLQCAVTVSNLAFAAYASGQRNAVDSNTTVRMRCGNDGSAESLSYSIALSRGSTGSFSPRAMSSDGNLLQYNVYRDAARSLIWGDGNEGTLLAAGSITLPGTGSSETIGYGRLFARQALPPGDYSDFLQVLVEY